ncbi:MAG: hypothetical protein K2X87_02480 [Gemmataceae bacterium]|nr:hypothetical protein [Gemmataceae bacterium]
MVRPFFAAVCGILLGCSVTAAGDGEAVKDKLDQAKATYEAKAKAVRDAVMKELQVREDQATKAGNDKIVERVETERGVYQKDGVFPTVVSVGGLKDKSEQAHKDLVAAYRAAVTGYTKDGMRAEVEQTKKELAEVQTAAADVRLKEMLATGAVLKGRKQNAGAPPNTLELKVSERNGRTFKGEITLGGTRTYVINGEIKDGKVSFVSEKKEGDDFKQTFKGSINGQQLDLTYEGQNNIKGTATLARKQ